MTSLLKMERNNERRSTTRFRDLGRGLLVVVDSEDLEKE